MYRPTNVQLSNQLPRRASEHDQFPVSTHPHYNTRQQASALGGAYAAIHLDAIITSDLKRAHATAVALLDGQPSPKPSFKVDRDLREQHFGDAEGQSWQMHRIPDKSLDDHFKDGRYPILFDRDQKFPKGESLNDVAARPVRMTIQLCEALFRVRMIYEES